MCVGVRACVRASVCMCMRIGLNNCYLTKCDAKSWRFSNNKPRYLE